MTDPTRTTSAEPAVFLVDDDGAVLASLARLLRAHGWQVHGFNSPRRFLESHDPNVPGCLVLDYSMPETSGLDVQQVLIQQGCVRPVIFLTGHADVPVSVRAMKQGAADFLTKPVEEADLIDAVKRAIQEDSQIRHARAAAEAQRGRFATLTPREREVFELVVDGLLNKQIASRLGTVEKTVKVHRARVMQKLEVDSLAELVKVAGALGIGTRV